LGQRGEWNKTNSVKASIDEHIEWLEQQLKEPVIKTFYERLLQKGKLKKVALTSCMHKLLIILNAMMKNHQTWATSNN
jgi:transposase